MTTANVTADLYSGRENPGWELTEAQTAEFQTRLAALGPGPAIAPSGPDGLGYRGVRVSLDASGTVQRLVFATGIVTVEAAGTSPQHRLRDPERSLEKWLLRTGSAQLGADLLRYALGE